MKNRLIYLSCIILFIWSCGNNNNPKSKSVSSETKDKSSLAKAQDFFKVLPDVADNPENPLTVQKVALGKSLYMDSRLSKTGHNSCNSCHNLSTYGVDNEPTSEGDAGKRGGRNSPTTLNAAFHFLQFWDGRAKNVEEQAGMPILNPVEMAIPNKEFLVKRLKGIKEYKETFAKAFPNDKDPVSFENLQLAIAAFERTLVAPSRFDKFIGGDSTAINVDEKKGLELFINTGCTSCHSGVLIGGAMFQKFGLANDYRPLTGSKGNDEGVKTISNKEEDKDFFKVPSLRNIAKTYPYFHDGSVNELSRAVKVMAKAQLNKDLQETEVNAIVKFLETITGELPKDMMAMAKTENK